MRQRNRNVRRRYPARSLGAESTRRHGRCGGRVRAQQGTAVTLTVPALQSVDERSVLTTAAAEMAARLVPLMLIEFLTVASIATALGPEWSPAA